MSSGGFVAEDHQTKLEQRVHELEQHVSELEQQIEQQTNKNYLQALIRRVLHESTRELERSIDDMDHTLLPIQKISRFPEEVAQEELSATAYRARFIWTNYEEYSHRASGGRTIKAGELRRILQAQAGENERIYTATVGRVMEAIVDLTRGIAEVNKGPDGERRLFVPNNWRHLAEMGRDQ